MSEILTPQNGDDPSDNRPRLVLDTNTVLALWMFRDHKLDALREWIEAGKCRLFSREDALEELRRVLAYPKFRLNTAAQYELQDGYRGRLSPLVTREHANNFTKATLLPGCRDPDDQKFLEIAAQAPATHLITRDKELCRLARNKTIRQLFTIVTPEKFTLPALCIAGSH